MSGSPTAWWGGGPSAPAAVVFLGDVVDRRACCPEQRCRCECGRCRAHTHYRRCERCAQGFHPPAAMPRLVTVTEKAARAFGEWPPRPSPDRLSHLRTYRRPERVE
jgi:hypothetical protein